MRNGSLTKRLRSERRTTESGSGCWPTPDSQLMNDRDKPESFLARGRMTERGDENSRSVPLAMAVKLAPWPTPDAAVMNDQESPETFEARRALLKEKGINGNGAGTPLAMAVKLWPTPIDETGRGPRMPDGKRGTNLTEAVAQCWATPQEADAVHHTPMVNQDCLIKQALEAEMPWPTPTDTGNYNRAGISPKAGDGLATAVQTTWPTPDANDFRSGGPNGDGHTAQLRHLMRGLLNPSWVEALMNWPAQWTYLPPEVFKSLAAERMALRRSTNGNRRAPSLRLNLLPRGSPDGSRG